MQMQNVSQVKLSDFDRLPFNSTATPFVIVDSFDNITTSSRRTRDGERIVAA